jgi:hypothetical protein
VEVIYRLLEQRMLSQTESQLQTVAQVVQKSRGKAKFGRILPFDEKANSENQQGSWAFRVHKGIEI